jgi:anti-sigma regulatory factor (Ser/Thr protein kinase)
VSTLDAVRECLSESYPAVPESVGRARREVDLYAQSHGASREQLEAIRLAVSEAVTNSVRHAYRDGTSGVVHLSAAVADGELWVLVADDGCGFQTPAVSPGLGLGLALIAAACDEFKILERGTGGTEARMCFRLPAEPG